MAKGPKIDTPEEVQAKKEAENLVQNLEKYLDLCLDKEKQFSRYTFIHVKDQKQIHALARLKEIFMIFGINPITVLIEKYKNAGWINVFFNDNDKSPVFSFIKKT